MLIPTLHVTELPDPLPRDLVLLDVREQDEWDEVRIDGAVHIPLTELIARLHEVPQQPIHVICKVGGRSAQAAGYLINQGYEAFNLDGGILDWQAAGRPVVTGTA